MKKLFLRTLLAASVIASWTSCEHKDLCTDHTHTISLNVIFDWQKAPDASPASMALYLYSEQGGEPLRYDFADRRGGVIRVPSGRYAALCLNSDNTDWAQFRGMSDIRTFEVFTREAQTLRGYSLATRSLPRVEGTENESIVATPGMTWSGRLDGIDLHYTDGEQSITLLPEEAVCHYTVDIINIINLKYFKGLTLDGTLSSMAQGYLPGLNRATDTCVTLPFTADVSDDKTSVHGEFLTFGDCPTTLTSHALTVYVILTDGTKWYCTFDVTDRIHSADDRRHVHILLDGLTLPKPIVNGGGFQPSVDEWQSVDVDIEM